MRFSVLLGVYIIFFFFYFFGWGLIGNMNSGVPYPWKMMMRPLKLSFYFYTLVTAVLAHFIVFRTFYGRRPWWKLWAALLLLLIFYILLRYSIEEIIFPATIGYSNYSPGTSFRFYIFDNLYFGSLIIFIGFVLFLFDELVRSQRQKKKLQALNREAELNFLQAQMNPHFLFNSLNNLYSLATDNHPKTADAILKMAGMMRYVSYERGKLVELSQEMEFVQALLEIEQLRRDYLLQVKMDTPADSLRSKLVPLLLIPLVENALKHGDLSDPAQPLEIQTSVIGQQLRLSIKNKIAVETIAEPGGIGLNNLKRRLELLYRPDEYVLTITPDKTLFVVTLLLPAN